MFLQEKMLLPNLETGTGGVPLLGDASPCHALLRGWDGGLISITSLTKPLRFLEGYIRRTIALQGDPPNQLVQITVPFDWPKCIL